MSAQTFDVKLQPPLATSFELFCSLRSVKKNFDRQIYFRNFKKSVNHLIPSRDQKKCIKRKKIKVLMIAAKQVWREILRLISFSLQFQSTRVKLQKIIFFLWINCHEENLWSWSQTVIGWEVKRMNELCSFDKKVTLSLNQNMSIFLRNRPKLGNNFFSA